MSSMNKPESFFSCTQGLRVIKAVPTCVVWNNTDSTPLSKHKHTQYHWAFWGSGVNYHKQTSLCQGNPWVATLCASFTWCQTCQKGLSWYHIDTFNTFQLEQSAIKRPAQKEGNCNTTTMWIGKTQHTKWQSVIMIMWDTYGCLFRGLCS